MIYKNILPQILHKILGTKISTITVFSAATSMCKNSCFFQTNCLFQLQVMSMRKTSKDVKSGHELTEILF